MRLLPIMAAAAFGLVATYGLANAQATNVAPKSGTAKTLSGTGTDVTTGQQLGQKPMKKAGKKATKKKAKTSVKQM